MATVFQKFMRRDAHPVIQFIKYGMAGGLATAVDLSVTYFLSWKVMPALTNDDSIVRLLGLNISPVDETVRVHHYWSNRAIAFVFGNLAAYIANILWVFQPGRHSRAKELSLFYIVSGVSFAIGTAIGASLIKYYGFTTTNALIGNIVASVMINYVGRKFFIFKG